jgi:anti-sigma factor RsiW
VDCRDAERLLHPYLDGELDLIHAAQVEHHLAECDACSEARRALLALREALAAGAPYRPAPAALRRRLRSMPRPRSRRLLAVALAASVLLLALAGLLAGALWRGADDRLTEQVVANHVRSLQAEHLTDVASSDRHAVKPWFRGRLDYSPPIADLSRQGFPLTGGRLDYLDERPVAALVYHRRRHAINVFVWPAKGAAERPVRSLSRQGYQLVWWERGGMAYWVISDLNAPELGDFVEALRASEATP